MTREEAIEIFEQKGWWIAQKETFTSKQAEEIIKLNDAVNFALTALRPVSRERVEKVWRGCEKCHNQDNWPPWIEKGFVYCPKCGTPLTSWAWEKQIKRLEALKDGSTAD